MARVLDGEDSKRMVKVMALFAIAKNTMAPDRKQATLAVRPFDGGPGA